LNLYEYAYEALKSDDVDVKESHCKRILELSSMERDDSDSMAGFVPEPLTTPSYAGRCEIVEPSRLPKRRNLSTLEGRAILLHSIAHIEYSAIDLAIDAVYRFPSMPMEYVGDWIEVALDEVRHYRMLESLLERIGYRYGDFPVHRGLFDIALHTSSDPLDRMAVIPRHYEATGLDVNPRIAQKLERSSANDPFVDDILSALEVIYSEEIVHVSKGDKWFKYICSVRNLDPVETFFTILHRYGLDTKRGGEIVNVDARLEAGFSCGELERLGAEKCP